MNTSDRMSMDYALKNFLIHDGEVYRKDGGDVCTYIYGSGYEIIYHSRYQTTMHRLAFWLDNEFDPDQIDHIDGNKLNNHPDNLRACNVTENNRNVGLSSKSTSGYKGVTWNKSAKKWHAQIRNGKSKVYLGLYNDPIDAAKAYDEAAIKYHGDFAKTNKMLGLI